jgi:septum formation protein
LEQIGVKFETIPSTIEEDISLKLNPDKFVEYYAEVKAKNVSRKNRDSLVIGADTVVVLNESILGKPGSFDEAYTMLSTLSGNTHSVYTGVSLQLINKSISHTFHAQTQVTFNNLTNKEIEFYIEYYKPYDKAGSYGIQDWFSVCVEKIDGCYFNVMGLPLNKLYTELKSVMQTN